MLDHIARGVPLSLTSCLGEDSEAMATLTRAMFDGHSDLAAQSDKDLFAAHEQQASVSPGA